MILERLERPLPASWQEQRRLAGGEQNRLQITLQRDDRSPFSEAIDCPSGPHEMRTTSTTLGLRSTSVQIRIHSCLPEFLLSRPRARAGEGRRS